ncbi:MAG: N-acetylglucosamine-6-phosphate deacetylase [Pseudomonadota bacterium]
MKRTATIGAGIFDGERLHHSRALLLHGENFAGIVDTNQIPSGYERSRVDGGTVLPGFIDLQVNGGGGVMFNDDPTLATVTKIAEAHACNGTRALLPTLITDTRAKTEAAIEAATAAVKTGVPGVLGIHLEGPHLSTARKGAHDGALIRSMDDADEALLVAAAKALPNVMVTVAPESVSPERIERLSKAGVIVSLGHTDCSFDTAAAAFAAGARCVTHLFNAMSQLGSREPGLVGAALQTGAVYAGLIADNVHVHAASMGAAIAGKKGPGRLFLVTDAMATAGSSITQFMLNDRQVTRQNGRLTLGDGTLAGADLTLQRAVSVLVEVAGVAREDALAMATSVPASLLRHAGPFGRFVEGQPANLIRLEHSEDRQERHSTKDG